VPLRGLDHPGPPRLCGAAVGEHRLALAPHLQHHAARASAALLKYTYIDTKCICFVNHARAGYAVPVHGDLPHWKVIFQVIERDLFGDQAQMVWTRASVPGSGPAATTDAGSG
jgi:hypothetical protein